MGQFLDNWEDGLRPNYTKLAGDLRRHKSLLSAGNENAVAAAHESFQDILRIAAKHIFTKAGDLADQAGISQGSLSNWMTGRKTAPLAQQISVIDTILEELDHRLAAKPVMEAASKPLTLSQSFAAAKISHLQTLNSGIDEIMGRGSDISNGDFHMALTTAQGLLYSDQATSQLAYKFNTSSPTYISWLKGDSAPRTDENRRNILNTISVDIALHIAGA